MATILIVDDSKFMRMRCVTLVRKLGHDTIEAGDGEQAIETYKRTSPNAVLLDITMPKKDGLEALEEIIAFDPDANIVMVTAVNQKAPALQAMKAGARGIVNKPYRPEQVQTALQKLVA